LTGKIPAPTLQVPCSGAKLKGEKKKGCSQKKIGGIDKI